MKSYSYFCVAVKIVKGMFGKNIFDYLICVAVKIVKGMFGKNIFDYLI